MEDRDDLEKAEFFISPRGTMPGSLGPRNGAGLRLFAFPFLRGRRGLLPCLVPVELQNVCVICTTLFVTNSRKYFRH